MKEYNKKLLKFNNGYLLELTNVEKNNERIGFAVFYNKLFDFYGQSTGFPIFQRLRESFTIRKDKDFDRRKPYLLNMVGKEVSQEGLLGICLEELIGVTKGSSIEEAKLDVLPIPRDELIQDYFHDELHCWIGNPVLNWSLNMVSKDLNTANKSQ